MLEERLYNLYTEQLENCVDEVLEKLRQEERYFDTPDLVAVYNQLAESVMA